MAGKSSIGRIAVDILGKVLKSALANRGTSGGQSSSTRGRGKASRSSGGSSSGRATTIDMPAFGGSASSGSGDGRDARRGEMDTADARPKIAYAPVRDDDADPGEIVWAYVPYEDDPSQGKDRPLLVIGHIEDDVAALALTSKDKDDRHHHALGTGPWDSQGRPSWIKLDRLLRLDPDGIRREGAVLDEQRFREVVAAWERY